MAIRSINEEKCVLCRNCLNTCPVDVFRYDAEKRKMVVRYPEDCGCCMACWYDCPTGAIDITPEAVPLVPRSW